MKTKYFVIFALLIIIGTSGCQVQNELKVEIYETTASGNQLTKIQPINNEAVGSTLVLHPDQEFQEIIGFGGAFTESSAYLLNQLSPEKRKEIIEAYFSSKGANYSLTRTHINSCDFSLNNYSYAAIPGDTELQHFSIDEDRDDIIPFIKDAQSISEDGFKIISSPWTAPPWMKDNQDWKGGKLLPEYYSTWALFFSKYLSAYQKEGIDIWAITVENEPLGNGANWESMHYTPDEMVAFTAKYLGPKLEQDGHQVKILGYDQNRDHVEEWVRVMYQDEESARYFDGTAVHWYASTFDWMPDALQKAHELAPSKHLIHTESCVDAEIPHWKDDAWYWKKEATDWGWDWAPAETKHLHPKYVPVYRYARDIIGCLNNWVEGWVDWNMVLDRQGGPNWAKNWCIAPIIVDPEQDEVYYTPLYFTMMHFSKFMRPGAKRIGFSNSDNELLATAVKNSNGSIAIALLNMEMQEKVIAIQLGDQIVQVKINPQAIQTIVIPSVR